MDPSGRSDRRLRGGPRPDCQHRGRRGRSHSSSLCVAYDCRPLLAGPSTPDSPDPGGRDPAWLAAAGGSLPGHRTRRPTDHDVLRTHLCVYLPGWSTGLGHASGEAWLTCCQGGSDRGLSHRWLELFNEWSPARHTDASGRRSHAVSLCLPASTRCPRPHRNAAGSARAACGAGSPSCPGMGIGTRRAAGCPATARGPAHAVGCRVAPTASG